jgi:hypothetical protein
MLSLCNNHGQTRKLLHRAIWEAFRGPIPKGLFVRHLDDNRDNNTIGNLAVGTRLDNASDAVRNDRILKGDKHPHAILTEVLVREIKARLNKGERHIDIANDVGVSRPTITAINQKRNWAHIT